jgi:hypothetical protein
MTNADKETLRANVSAYMQSTQPDPEPLPLPPATPPGLSAEQKAILADNWVADIQTRRADSWTGPEKAAVRAAINRALKTL